MMIDGFYNIVSTVKHGGHREAGFQLFEIYLGHVALNWNFHTRFFEKNRFRKFLRKQIDCVCLSVPGRAAAEGCMFKLENKINQLSSRSPSRVPYRTELELLQRAPTGRLTRTPTRNPSPRHRRCPGPTSPGHGGNYSASE
jgi:hypothetical protein